MISETCVLAQTWRKRFATGISSAEARDAAEHPAVHRCLRVLFEVVHLHLAAASPRKLLEKRILRPHPSPAESEPLGLELRICGLTSPPGNSKALKFERPA